MSRYEQFQEEHSTSSLANQQQDDDDLVCIKSLLPSANPLMNKIQFTPYEPKNYFPVHLTKLPPCLSQHQYHIDRNNMALIDESLFSHHMAKRELARVLGKQKCNNHYHRDLMTLRQFYAGKALLYEKFTGENNSNYFATFTLSMNAMCKQGNGRMGKSGFIIRNTKTPLLTQRCRTERLGLACRSQIDFNSNFQSGNLYRVYQREYNQYDLVLQNDINTRGNNQWFFFSVKNVPRGTTVKFNIVNMAKRYSLFDYGMKPSVFSMMKFEKRNIGWVRDGTKVSYAESKQLKKEGSQYPYFTLSFQHKFTYDGDIVYFSYSIPYTFANLCSYLMAKLSDRSYSSKVKVRGLGQTLGGNEVTLLELTNTEKRCNKKTIWILGRQHSGEVTSSFMVEGIINFLLSEAPQAAYLMDNYVFRIVPMLNVDGVVHGNTRAELSGHDPNRKWADPSKIYQPIIYTIKKMIEKDTVEMILDLHSHSRKLGTFFYCNSSPQFSNMIKIFPMLVCKNDERFDYRSNRFRGGNNHTARRIFYELLNIPYIYTIESSLFGYQKENDFRIIQYQPNDYRQMGISVLTTFAEMARKKNGLHLKDLRQILNDQNELQQEQSLWEKMNEVDDIESIGSDEDPVADELSKKELDAILEKKIKKKVKPKKPKAQKKVKVEKKIEQPKRQEELLKKKNDKDSFYKQYFSGRSSLNPRMLHSLYEAVRPKVETRNFGSQVEIPQKAVLHKSSMNVVTSREMSTERLFEKKSLCVVGQKVEDGLTIQGCSVGVQVELNRQCFRSRKDVMLENRSVRRVFKSSSRVGTGVLHNENNFLNKGDILHTALRMLNKR